MEKKLDFKNLYENVVENGYDFGTGSWAVVNDNIEMKMDKFGAYHPISKKDLSSFTNKEIEILKQVCLSTSNRNEDTVSNNLFGNLDEIKYDKQIGYYSDLFVGHVIEEKIRKNASSGGLATWILKELLDKNLVDGVIQVAETNNPDKLFEYTISTTIEDVLSRSKTRYYPVEYSEAIKTIKETPGNYAIIGLPSYIMEIRLLMELDEVLKERIKYTIGLICGHQKTSKYADFLAWQCGINPGNLERIDFRKKIDNEPASSYAVEVTGLVNGDRKTIVKRMRDLRGADWGQGFFKVNASDYTDDVYNETADVTLGDAWLPEYTGDSKGNNVIIVRNPVIANIIKTGIIDGNLSLDRVDIETIKKSQESHYRHTHDELAYRLYKKDKQKMWHPEKRVKASNNLSWVRKKIQDKRLDISTMSSNIFLQAVASNDITLFFDRLKPKVKAYHNLYRIKRVVKKLIN